MSAERINPSYYASQAGLECIDVIERFGLPFCRSNALKYLWRHKQKNGKEDLIKALWYLDREVSGPQRLPACLRWIDAAYRWSQGVRRRLVSIDSDLLAAACGVTGREKVALLEICRGSASQARFQVERIIAEQYGPAGGSQGGDAVSRAVVTAIQADAAIAAMANLPRREAGQAYASPAAAAALPPVRIYAPPVECPEPPAGD